MISLEIHGAPVPWARPRISSRGPYVRFFDSQLKLKEGYKWQVRSQYKEDPMGMPLAVDLVFFMPIPKSTSSLKKRQMANGVLAHVKKPDVDNLQKFVLDCLNKLAFVDDSQIVELRSKKIYSNHPRTLVRLIPLADEKRELLYENCSREG